MSEISVIVPVYNAEKYIHRCVDSILGQTYADFELILVDDGSPDNCGAICDEYAAKDSRVVVIHQQNGGLSAARNAGIDWAFAHSDSQWLSFIDSDDWVHPEYLQRLLDAALEHDVSVSICGYAETSGPNPTIDPAALAPTLWNVEDFYIQHNLNATIACGKLYHKESFREIRYPVGKLHEDEFITYKILFQLPSVAVIQAPLYAYYSNPMGIIGSRASIFRDDKYVAVEEQIQFLYDHGFMGACRSQIRLYMCLVCDKLDKFAAKIEESPSFYKIIKTKKRQFFPRYAKILLPDDPSDAWVLTRVYPKRMWVYWRLRAILRKLRIVK